MYGDPKRSLQRFSVGNKRLRGSLEFFTSEWCALPARYLIPQATALMVIKEWVQTGHVSDEISWQDEWY